MLLWRPKHFHNTGQLLLLVFARENRIAGIKLGQDTANTPHINCNTVAHTENNLWGSVESRLNVGVDLFVLKAAGTEIDDLDLRVHRVSKQDIFWLEITVYNLVHLEKKQTTQKLFGEPPNELQGEPLEAIIFNKLVKVHIKKFSREAKMATEVETLREVNHAMPVRGVLLALLVKLFGRCEIILTHSRSFCKILTSTSAC